MVYNALLFNKGGRIWQAAKNFHEKGKSEIFRDEKTLGWACPVSKYEEMITNQYQEAKNREQKEKHRVMVDGGVEAKDLVAGKIAKVEVSELRTSYPTFATQF